MTQLLDWLELGLDLISALLVLVLWRSYRKSEPVTPQIYLVTMVCSALFLSLYVAAMPAGQWLRDLRFAGPAAVLGFLWGLSSTRGMILFRVKGRHFLRGSIWMPLWATLNLIGSESLEEFGEGLWGVGGLAVMVIASMAAIAANLGLLLTLLRIRKFYHDGARKGGRFHFCHACGAGFERRAKCCPACGASKERAA